MMKTPIKEIKSGQEMANYLSEILKPLFQQFEVEFAYLGGSWAKNKNFWWSDIDLCLSIPTFNSKTSQQKLGFFIEVQLKTSQLLEDDNIDISIIQLLPPHVQFSFIESGFLLYERSDGIHKNFIQKLLPKYYDHSIWFENLINTSFKNYIEGNKINEKNLD